MKRLLVAAIAAPITLAVTAPATAQDTGGLAVSPALIERTAQRGSIGTITVANNSSRSLKVTVAARPWIQSRSGTVRPNARKRLAGVRLDATSFTLAPGATRAVAASLTSAPARGSVYGGLEVIGTPQGQAPSNGVVTRYRLVGVLRLNPSQAQRRLRLRIGAARPASGGVALRVTNTGNTVRPVTGSARITGPAGTVRGSIAAQRIIPGSAVDLPLRRGSLPRGSYRATVTLRQGGRAVATATRRFVVR
jgi:hypothetical protein